MNYSAERLQRLGALAIGGLMLTASLPSCVSREGAPASAEERQELAEIMFADPTVFGENGKYYMTGTRNSEPLGFVLLESDDLQTWREAMDTMLLSMGDNVFGTQGFWAPQILRNDDGTYTLAYTANEQTVVARADSLLSPFAQVVLSLIHI